MNKYKIAQRDRKKKKEKNAEMIFNQKIKEFTNVIGVKLCPWQLDIIKIMRKEGILIHRPRLSGFNTIKKYLSKERL